MTRHPATEAMLAVSALEGWTPREDDSPVLDLVDAAAPAATVLRAVRSRVPDGARRAPRPGVFTRRRPYLLRGTGILENALGITSREELARAEALLVVDAGARLLRDPTVAPDTVTGVHAALFADVYRWAGLPRIVEVSKPGSAFVSAGRVPAALGPLERPAEVLAVAVASPPTGATRRVVVAHALAGWYARFNHVHPFREGNGRAAAVTALLAARRHGIDLDFARTDRHSWVQAAVSSMPVPPRRRVDPTAHAYEFLRIAVERPFPGCPADALTD